MKELTAIEELRQEKYKKTFQIAKKMHMVQELKFACYAIANWNTITNIRFPNTKLETNPLKIMDIFARKKYDELNSLLVDWHVYMKNNKGCLNLKK